MLPLWGTLDNVDFGNSGILNEETLVAEYCRRTGRGHIDNLGFYTAFALFRLAAISQGVYKRGLDGIGTGHGSSTQNGAIEIAGYGVVMLDSCHK